MSALTSEFTRSFFPLCWPDWPGSFEPSPDNQAITATRDLSNVRLTHAAVGERSGECELYVSDKPNVDHRTDEGYAAIHAAPFH